MVKPLLLISAIPVQFAESAYICGFRLQISQIPLTFTDSSIILRIHLRVRNSDN